MTVLSFLWKFQDKKTLKKKTLRNSKAPKDAAQEFLNVYEKRKVGVFL